MITFAKEFEPNVLSTFFASVLKAKNFTKNVWAYNKCFRDSEILQFLKDNFYLWCCTWKAKEDQQQQQQTKKSSYVLSFTAQVLTICAQSDILMHKPKCK